MKRNLSIIFMLIFCLGILAYTGCSDDSTDPNTRPEIRAIDANPGSVEIGTGSEVSCTAIDVDGDALTYAWSADVGTFDDVSANTTIWTAPDAVGLIPLKCTVSDGDDDTWATVRVTVIRLFAAQWTFDEDFSDIIGGNDFEGEATINNDDFMVGSGSVEFDGWESEQ
ncbi:MAG: hypothetical protein GY869_18585, partial [Planctomycetes bacterium]|nr:hypothetical protein [Planctomycetota bacterium]